MNCTGLSEGEHFSLDAEKQRYRRSEGSLLIRLALLTMLVVFVSVIIVSSFLIVNLRDEISADTDYYYSSRFTYNTSIVDQQLFSPVIGLYEELKIFKGWRENMVLLSQPMVSQVPIVDMQKLLKQRVTMYNNIADIAVSSPMNDYIISAVSGVYFMDDHAVMYPFDSAWVNAAKELQLTSPVMWMTRRSYPSGIGVNGDVFSYVAVVSYKSLGGGLMYVCISMPCSAFESLIETDLQGSLFVVDGDGKCVLGQADGEFTFEGEGRFEMGDTVYYAADSGVAPWRYVMAVPKSLYNRKIDLLTGRTLAVSLVVLAVMAIVCWTMLKRLTSPFNAMLERARSLHVREYDRRHGELQFVADSFGTYISRAELVQHQLDASRSTLRKSFLMSCLCGKRMEEKELRSYFRFLDVKMELPYYRVLVLNNNLSDFREYDEERIEKIASGNENEGLRLYSAGSYSGRMYFIVNSDMEGDGIGSLLEEQLNNSIFGYDISVIEGESSMSFSSLTTSVVKPEREPVKEDGPVLTQCTHLAEQYINENYQRDISVQEIADAAGVSRSHLSRVFKEERGMTLLEYILGVRLTAAMKLLDETDMNVSGIAALVGFNNTNYFYRCFKAHYGVTPNEYRSAKKTE